MQSRMNNTGYFVAVDGPNGSGKTTVINAIAEKLGLMGYKVKVTREPTNSIWENLCENMQKDTRD